MKLSDYLVQFFVDQNVEDFFGYQGTMIAHFVDSISKNSRAHNHFCCNEQGAAFAACGYAAAKGSPSLAYATSGPGALNLVSGIANAYYDSLPVVFITGQINTFEYRLDIPELRQAGFQETKTVDVVRPICKYAVQIRNSADIRYELEKAMHIATTGRRGPVVLDIPMDIQRAEIDPQNLKSYLPDDNQQSIDDKQILDAIRSALAEAQRPVFLIGNGMNAQSAAVFVRLAQVLKIPIVTSLLGKRWLPADHPLNYGYLGGAYGHRYANMIVDAKCDQIISLGMSLCTRQTGTRVSSFAPNAKVLRFDIDPIELRRKIKPDEQSYLIDTSTLAEILENHEEEWCDWKQCSNEWLTFCSDYREVVKQNDRSSDVFYPNRVIEAFNCHIHSGDVVVSDVGQHMMWVGQSVEAKEDMLILFSGGHGAMGFSLPAAIGAALAKPESTVYCFCGDGGMQMNIQELEWVNREKLNIVIIIMNNDSLGLIVQQQEAYFNCQYCGSVLPDYSAPDFCKIARAYDIKAYRIRQINQIDRILCVRNTREPMIIEYRFDSHTKAFPKTLLGERIYNQEPHLPREILEEYLNR